MQYFCPTASGNPGRQQHKSSSSSSSHHVATSTHKHMAMPAAPLDRHTSDCRSGPHWQLSVVAKAAATERGGMPGQARCQARLDRTIRRHVNLSPQAHGCNHALLPHNCVMAAAAGCLPAAPTQIAADSTPCPAQLTMRTCRACQHLALPLLHCCPIRLVHALVVWRGKA